MYCSKCGSNNTRVELVNETKLKVKHHGRLFWILIGWWLYPILWLFFTIPMLIIKLIGGKKYKSINKTKKYLICNNCGNSKLI